MGGLVGRDSEHAQQIGRELVGGPTSAASVISWMLISAGSREVSSVRAAATRDARVRAFRRSSRLVVTSASGSAASPRAFRSAVTPARSAVSSGMTSPFRMALLPGSIKTDHTLRIS
jgi:hypothetical protein